MSKMDGMEEGGSGLTEGGQTDPLGPKSPLGSPASQTSHLPPFPCLCPCYTSSPPQQSEKWCAVTERA